MRQNLVPCSLALLIGAGATFWSDTGAAPSAVEAPPVVGAPELDTVVIDLDEVFDNFPRLAQMQEELDEMKAQFEADFDATVQSALAELGALQDEMELVKPRTDRARLLVLKAGGLKQFIQNAKQAKEQTVRERVAAARNDRLLEVQEDIERGLQAFAEQSAKNGEPIGMILRRRSAREDDPTPTKLVQRDYGDVLFADARLDVTARVIQFFKSWGPAQPKNK